MKTLLKFKVGQYMPECHIITLGQHDRNSGSASTGTVGQHEPESLPMNVINSIPAYYKEINIPPPKHNFFHIGNYSENLQTIKRKQLPIKHSLYSISLVKRWGANLKIDNAEAKFNLFILSPFRTISWDISDATTIEGNYIIFDIKFIESNTAWENFLTDFTFFRFDRQVSGDVPEDLVHTLEECLAKIKDEYFSERPDKFEMIKGYVHIILVHLKRHFAHARSSELSNPTNKQKLLSTFEALLLQNISTSGISSEARHPSFYASMLNVHVNYLNVIMKELTGKTTSSIINEHIILRASVFMKQPDLPMKEIAYRFQFSATTHFISFFKKHTGKTPRQFRAKSNL